MSIDQFNGQPPRLLPRTIEDFLRNWMVRGGGFALVVGAMAIWVAMLTWSANDPSLSLNTSEPAKNMLGTPGAMIADFFFHTLGLSVIFFVVPALVLGLQLGLGDVVTDHRRRLALYAVATIAIAGGCSALPLTAYWPLELGYGGIIGDFAYSLISTALSGAAPDAAGTIAGLLYFVVGFWAFSRAICLDRYNVFTLRLSGSGSAAAGVAGQVAKTGGLRLIGRLRRMKPMTSSRSQDDRQAYDGGFVPAHDRRDAWPSPDAEFPDADFPTSRPNEPEPPKWSLDQPIHDFDQVGEEPWRPAARVHERRPETVAEPTPVPETDQELVASPPPTWQHHEQEDDGVAGGIAKRFASRPPTSDRGDVAERTDEPEVILLDDEAAAGDDDLPNVLKRARQEVAEILPTRSFFKAAVSQTRPPPIPKQQLAAEDLAEEVHAAKEAVRKQAASESEPKVVATGYRRPSLNLLKMQKAARPSADASPSVLQGRARMLEDVLSDFRIKGEIQDVRPGPVITLFELEPARGTKSSRVITLADDVARSMSAASARIAVVPGRNAIGIELPNTQRETFGLRELIDSQTFADSNAKLPLVLGKAIGGEPVLADLSRMPHLLVAGTTGSGKSVGVNAMIMSLIYRLGPQDCRFLMIDPKMLELSSYNGIPHLLTPVITDPQKAVTALAWAVGEMEERYKRMAELGVRSIDAFNNRVKHARRTGENLGRTVQTGFDPATGEAVFEEKSMDAETIPYIVVIVDEFADLMAVAGKEIEGLVQRLAQMARAAGIHMIMATQRPSVDVVTGTIKANFPTRISYRVASRIDSRTILNEQGGEQLLGHGDMLFLNETGNVQRVHGPYVSDEEVEAITNALRTSYPPEYVEDVLSAADTATGLPEAGKPAKAADLYDEAVAIVLRDQKASTSYLQRRLSIGYNRAADLIDRMEAEGVIGTADHAGRRQILLAS